MNLLSGRFLSWLLLLAFATTGCRSSYYSMMETFGKHKRDLLRDALEDASTENQEAAEQFKDALTQLKELTGFDGGSLEQHYSAFKREYDGCVDRSKTVHGRIEKVDRVANDLFAEWERELKDIQNPTLRASSQSKLTDTRVRYQQVHRALARSEATLEPVLSQMQDYVLYLKHNLNARAVGSIKDEALEIENEIVKLIAEMTRSIQETEGFLKVLEE
jgi:F0F1-type ATP synthase membrane subunit b/b'